MQVKMVAMAMRVNMDTAGKHPAKDADAQNNQQKTDQALERRLDRRRNDAIGEQNDGAKYHQGDRVTQGPEHPQAHNSRCAAVATGQGRHRGQMVGVQGVPHAKQKSEHQDRGHYPSRLGA